MRYRIFKIQDSKGQKLSQKFWNTYLYPYIRQKDQSLLEGMTAGLFSEGSECFGFDDELSTDHDFGNSIIIVLNDKKNIEPVKNSIQEVFKNNPNLEKGRIMLYTNDEYFLKFTSFRDLPKDKLSYMKIPLNYLSTMANGFIFFNTNKEFIKKREEFLNIPSDVVLKHISYRLIMAGKAGQYNLKRSIQRKDFVSSQIFRADFMKNYMEAVCLLNLYIPPYDKWLYKTTRLILGKDETEILRDLAEIDIKRYGEETLELVEKLSKPVVKALNEMKLATKDDGFLVDLGTEMFSHIKDENILSLGPWFQVK